MFSIVISAFFKLYLILNIYQQAHYQIRPYLKHFIYNFVFYDLFIFVVYFIGVSYGNVVKYICEFYIICFSFIFLLKRKKLIFTNRIIRLSILSGLILFLYSFVPIYLLIIEFSIVPVFLVEQIISYFFNKPFLIKAKSKLAKYKYNIIGITGSFGKTSTKVLLNQSLLCFNKSLCSPKSYNTPLGIARFINDNNISIYDNLILEYGVSKSNDMDYLLDICIPDVVFITEIGYMHMDGFNSFEKILEEKMKLAKSAKKIIVLNYENQYIRNYDIYSDVKIISYGFSYGTYQGKIVDDYSFDLYKDNALISRFRLPFYGKHQILNMIGVLAYLNEEGYDLNVIKKAMIGFKLEKNRLEYKKIKDRIIIDDSFNSNYKGYVEALNLLNNSLGYKILMTPGIVELGKYKNELMDNLVEYIVRSCNCVILVGYYQTKRLFDKLILYNIEVYVARNFMEGYEMYLSIARYYKESSLLIENDLPDLYRIGFLW